MGYSLAWLLCGWEQACHGRNAGLADVREGRGSLSALLLTRKLRDSDVGRATSHSHSHWRRLKKPLELFSLFPPVLLSRSVSEGAGSDGERL